MRKNACHVFDVTGSNLKNDITQEPVRQKPLELTTWLRVRWREPGRFKKGETGFVHSYLRKSRVLDAASVLSTSLISPQLHNVWENQEPKCRKRRLSNGRRVVRWADPAGLPSVVHGSWQRWVGWYTCRALWKKSPRFVLNIIYGYDNCLLTSG